MTINGPYIREHQLPADLPLKQMANLLLWRLAIVARIGLLAIFIFATVLVVVKSRDFLRYAEAFACLGFGLAWCLNLLLTDNPSGVPISRIASRALPGMLVSMILSMIVFQLVVIHIPWIERDPRIRFSAALFMGLLIFPTIRMTDKLLPRKLSNKHPFVATFVQWLDLGLYISRIISMEERKLVFEFRGQNDDATRSAIHRVYEFHLIEIARSECARRKKSGESPDLTLEFFEIRNVEIKLKLLIRFMGYRAAMAHVRSVAAAPQVLFEYWPPAPEDRRSASPIPAQHRLRRKYEQPYVKAYVLGHF